MDVKIPGGPGGPKTLEGLEATDSATDASSVESAQEVADVITQVADDLAAGRVTGEEALRRIVTDVMNDPMVASAPAEFKEGLQDMLRALVETDPTLMTLAAQLGLKFE